MIAQKSQDNLKAQTSVEFLLILAASMFIIVIIAILVQSQINTVQTQKNSMDAKNSLLDLSSAAKEVYAQGEGSKKLVYVQLPSSYEANQSFVINKTIWIRAAGTDYVSIENFNVHGRLPNTPGSHWVWVVSEGNRVRIGDAMMELNKNRIYLVMNSDTTTTESFTVENIWIKNIDINTHTTWTTADVTLSGVPLTFQLSVNETDLIQLQFVAGSGSSGVYYGGIELNADDGYGATESTTIPITVVVISPGQEAPTTDILGPIITEIYQDPAPAVKLQQLDIYVTATDLMTGNNTIINCEIDADNANDWQDMLPVDGAYDQVTETTIYNYTEGFALGPHTIRSRCTDFENNTGSIAYYYFNVSEADQLGPIVLQMTHSEYPTTLSNITVGGIATDAYTGNSNIQGCNVKIDSGAWVPVTAVDGLWNSPTENFTYEVGSLAVGYHTVYYQCTDSLDNIGGIYEDTFGIVDVDLMLVIDRSGSMEWNVTNEVNSNTVSASSTGWSWVKSMTVSEKNGDSANMTVEIRSTKTGCTTYYNATINGVQISTGQMTGTTYTFITDSIDITDYEPPFTLDLWLKRVGSSCTSYNRLLSVQQLPSKMDVSKDSAKVFLDVAGEDIQAGLVSFSTSATTNKQLALMEASNQEALKNAIDALAPTGSTCLECGLVNAANELTSARGRPAANKVIVMLTDGVGNVGDTIDGAVYCRERNITVYTIGFGNDVDDTELTNIALLTHGDYYFAPNAETLLYIFSNIGKNN